MDLKILSFSGKTIEKKNVISVTMMTKSGEITVLNNHSPLITSIKPSTMYFVFLDENNMKVRDDLAVGNGVIEISNNQMKIMIDMLVDIEDLDLEPAKRAKADALKIMQEYKNSEDQLDMKKFIEAEDNLLKSIAQLKLYDIKNK